MAGLSRWHLRTVVGACLVMLAGPLTIVTFALANQPMARALGVSTPEVMATFSVMTLGNALTMTLLGDWVARLGAWSVVIGAGLWSVASLVGFSSATSLWQVYLASAGLGLSAAIGTGMAATLLIGEWFEARRGTFLGVMSASVGFTGLILGLVLPPAIAAGGWSRAYLVTAALMFCLTVLPGIFLIRSRPSAVGLVPFGVGGGAEPAPEGAGVSLTEALRGWHFWVLAGCLVSMAAGQAMLQHVAPVARPAGLDLAAVGAVVAVQAVSMIPIQFAAGWASDRFGIVPTVLACVVTQAVGFAGLLVAREVLGFGAALVAFGVGVCVPTVLVPIIVRHTFGPRDYPAILGPMMAGMPAGLALGAPLWSLDVGRSGGYQTALLAAILVTAAVGGALVWVLRTTWADRASASSALAWQPLPAVCHIDDQSGAGSIVDPEDPEGQLGS